MSTRESGSSTQSTGTSWIRSPRRWASTSSSVSKNQPSSRTSSQRAGERVPPHGLEAALRVGEAGPQRRLEDAVVRARDRARAWGRARRARRGRGGSRWPRRCGPRGAGRRAAAARAGRSRGRRPCSRRPRRGCADQAARSARPRPLASPARSTSTPGRKRASAGRDERRPVRARVVRDHDAPA